MGRDAAPDDRGYRVKTRTALALLLCSSPLPVLAQSAPSLSAISSSALPPQLGPNARARYQDIFASIDAGKWDDASTKLMAMDSGPLHPVARAIMYTAKGSPKVEAPDLVTLATIAPDLPQSPSLIRLAGARGAETVPLLPEVRNLGYLGTSPRRSRTAATAGDPETGWMAAQIIPLIKDNRPIDAEAVLITNEDKLTPEGRTEWRQRVAWSYFIESDDTNARRVASTAQSGTGEWAAMADWVAGLAAWRQKDYVSASAAFASIARRSTDSEMIAAGHYWAARADMVLKRPEQVQPHLRSAARLEETFYGMLAQAAMGLTPQKDDDGSGAIRKVVERPNVRAALALAEIGQLDRADELIRWQARIGVPSEHATLTLIAGKLNLPQTQLYLAHNGPPGARTTIEGRYPMPTSWQPDGGWRIDRALVYAHALQESRFQTKVVSPAGARGLMQVMPATAQFIARRKGMVMSGSLASPSTNMEYGQSYIETLRDMASTGGLLPKVIMAYNAGPAPLERWNMRDETTLKDPLLYIESIPYWETRGYVTIVLRNYWMYQQQAGVKSESRDALVQGIWPRFPGVSGASGIRVNR
jgi:soluble lytic murein transglycosylase